MSFLERSRVFRAPLCERQQLCNNQALPSQVIEVRLVEVRTAARGVPEASMTAKQFR
jgi:hypothetical protein